jgi:hypothetical protein
MADGQIIHPDVYRSLALQKEVDIHLMIITRPKEATEEDLALKKEGKKRRTDRKSISVTRNLLLDHINKLENCGDFVLSLDSDVVLCKDHDIIDMANFLKGNLDFGAVALNTQGGEHIRMACLLIRWSILSGYRFNNGPTNTQCNCQIFRDYLNGKGLKIKYLDDRPLTEMPRFK